MTDPAKAEVTALEVVLSRLEVSALVEKGLGLISHPLLFTSMALVVMAFMFRMAGNLTRNAMGEDAEPPGKALAVLVCTCLALVLYRHALDLSVRLSEGILSIFQVADMQAMAAILDGLLDKHFEGLSIFDFIDPGSMFMGLALVAYGITALLLILMVGIYGVALAYSFIILIILGYLVIPMSLASRSFDMTSGWIKMVLTVLMWPIFERLVFITSSWIMLDVAQAKELSLVDGPDAAAAACIAFTILNCMMCAGVYYAPRMAAAVCINSGDLSPSLEPFGKAAFGATMAVKMSSLMAFGMAKKVGGNLAHNATNGFMNRFATPDQGPGGGPQSNFNTDGQSNVNPKDASINSGFNRAMGMNTETVDAGKTGNTVSRMGEPGSSSTATATTTSKPPVKSAPVVGESVETHAKFNTQSKSASLSTGADSVAGSKEGSSMQSAKPATSPYTGAPSQADAKPYNKTRTLINSYQKETQGMSTGEKFELGKEAMRSFDVEVASGVMEKANPPAAQGGTVASSEASPKSQQKSPEELKKAKDRKNAIIRQNMNRAESFKWSPKEDPKT